MNSDSSSTRPPLPPAPEGMVEWSSTAARLQRAVSRAYPNRAPEEVEALVDRLWKHALRGATLAGVLDSTD